MAEYEAIIICLELAIEMHIDQLEVFGDSQLIIRQINGQYEVRNAKLLPLCQRTKNLMAQFLQIKVNHVPRSENDKADTLAKLAASLTLPDEREIQITVGEHHLLASALDRFDDTREANVLSVFEVKEKTDWRQPVIEYIQYGILPTDLKKRVDVKRRALRFTLKNDTLYRKAFEGVLLRCLLREEASYVLNEVHAGVCRAY